MVKIWDLSLERDAEEEAEFRAKMKEQANTPADLPPQLLFVHQLDIGPVSISQESGLAARELPGVVNELNVQH
ncbi:hypothetical protein ABZP36_009062 [Zizania latifolia]